MGFIFLYNFGNNSTLLPDLYNSTHHQNPENVKIRLKIGRIMWNLPLKIARIMWKAPIKLWEIAICKSRIQQITKQIYLSYLIDISNNMI